MGQEPTIIHPSLLLLALTACQPTAEVCTDALDNDGDALIDCDDVGDCAAAEACTDADGDRHMATEDCDDLDPAAHPGASEVCDEIDNDCDGAIDEGDAVDASLFYADSDGYGYGYGDPDTATVACAQPSGYVGWEDATDCDDDEPAAHPGGTEVCDGADDDCDGLTDDDDPDVTGLFTWYLDYDGDGYGAESGYTLTDCAQPAGYADNAEDCDDFDAGVNPDVLWYSDADGDGYGDPATATAACYAPSGMVADGTDCDVHPGADEWCDGVDHDCDGLTHEDDSLDAPTWYADADGDGYGDAAATTTACALPSGYSADATDCDDDDAEVNPGATEICNNFLDDDCDGDPADCTFAPDQSLAGADAVFTGAVAGDLAGGLLADAGDVNADGYADFLVGAINNDGGGAAAGAAYLVLGGASPAGGSLGSALDFEGEAAGDYAGSGVSGAGDVDGDGFDDLLIGAVYNDAVGTDAGAAYLVLGSAIPGSLPLAYAQARFTGEAAVDSAGYSVTGVGDVNVVSGRYNDAAGIDAGAAYLILGLGL